MSEDMHTQLNKLLIDNLAKYSFQFAESTDDVDNPGFDELIVYGIEIKERSTTELLIAVHKELATQIAGNLLGETDDELGDQEVLDSVGEFCNVLAGHVAPVIYGSQSECQLLPPFQIPSSEERIQKMLKQPNTLKYLVDYEFPLYFSWNEKK